MNSIRLHFLFLVSLFILTACAQAPVQTSVDSEGVGIVPKTAALFFTSDQHGIDDLQTVKECRTAAAELGFKTAEQKCSDCTQVNVKTRVTASETVTTSSPTLMSAGGMFGDERSLGLGLSNRESVRAKTQTSRELMLTLYQDTGRVIPAREIVVKSVGTEASVATAAKAMCKAAFTDYPENLKSKRYDIKR